MLSGPLERIIWVRPRPQTWASVPSLALYDDVWDWVKLGKIVIIVGAGAAVCIWATSTCLLVCFCLPLCAFGSCGLEAEFGVFSVRRERYLGNPSFGAWDYCYCSSPSVWRFSCL